MARISRKLLRAIQQNYYMLKIDLEDAYYSVKILEERTKYLLFWQDLSF